MIRTNGKDTVTLADEKQTVFSSENSVIALKSTIFTCIL
jgi:hypothetical protein